MNKNLKSSLRTAFDAPQSTGKTEFLRNLPFPKASNTDFFFSQIGYIRKRSWLCSALLFILLMFTSQLYNTPLNVTWIVSSILPFFALISITEITRSTTHGMSELESSCKHSLSQVTLVRLLIVGSMNAVIFLSLLLTFIGKTDLGLLRFGVYLFMPFLISSYTLLLVTNRFRGSESIYVCAAITGFISISNVFIHAEYSVIFTEKHILLCLIAFGVFTIAVIMQIIKLLKRTEDAEWSLSLTA